MSEFNKEDFKGYSGYIISEIEEGFYHVQFNNPKVLNAFSEQTWRDYHEILTKLDQLELTNIILISSVVPKAFSSGLNMKEVAGEMSEVQKGSEQERYDKLLKHIKDFQYCIGTPARIRTPTICLLNGISYGLALDICACCTIRVATEDVKLSIREIKIGIVADIGSLQRLPALINNKSFLNEMALTGAVFGGQKALEVGLVSKVFPDLKTAEEYCKQLGSDINQNPQWAIKGTKESIQYINDGGTAEQGLENIALYNAKNIGGTFSNSKL
ncbi:uncharacterized protein PRCAT00002790001 [Priceomyces carsonii]|uniref:uncharacterized protein n=1 Tax=Priceomyces carsonii TaxID=28549 RepID=UPI002EDA281B|nr:unnamed protein product [Priceomyces carsonii]